MKANRAWTKLARCSVIGGYKNMDFWSLACTYDECRISFAPLKLEDGCQIRRFPSSDLLMYKCAHLKEIGIQKRMNEQRNPGR